MRMDSEESEEIDKLLEKYWNCETSLEEEKHLQAYFHKASVPESLKETANLFRYFEEHRKQDITDISFDKDLTRKIKIAKGKMASLLFNSMRIAAGIAVLFIAVWFVRTEVRQGSPAEMTDTYDDPRMAFEETKRALMMISKSFSTAEEQAKKINIFNEAQEDLKNEKPEL